MSEYTTVFGSLDEYDKGGVQVIDDDPKNYVFSNVFEVAKKAEPYERIAVAKNFEYVVEAIRAQGESPWYACNHDEFLLCLDGEIEIHLVKPADASALDLPDEGAKELNDAPDGQKMGRIILRRGHMGMMPAGSAYRFAAKQPGVGIIQTIEGPVTVQKWAEICQTE